MTDEEKEAKKREEAEAAKKEREAGESVLVNLKALKEVVIETVEETVSKRLKDAGVGEVNRGRVVVNAGGEDDDKRMAGQSGRAIPAFEALYRGLPEWERDIRSPDTDHWIADWAVGVMRNDHARMARAHDEINKITGVRDLNISDDSSLVPSPLADVIVEKKRKIQVIGPRSQIFVSESTTLEIPVEATFAAAAGVAEGGTITPTDPPTSQPPVACATVTDKVIEFMTLQPAQPQSPRGTRPPGPAREPGRSARAYGVSTSNVGEDQLT